MAPREHDSRPIAVFDLDGTLADCEHRVHLVKGHEKDWEAFFLRCIHDSVIESTASVFRMIRSTGLYRMEIWTGRSDVVINRTTLWLNENDLVPDSMMMRENGDYTPDHILKRHWVKQDKHDGRKIAFAFEDRSRVVRMWRKENIQCFQTDVGGF